MGNCLSSSSTPPTLPIDSKFSFPSPHLATLSETNTLTGGFASGTIDLGRGLHVCQISSFNKIWAARQGGPDNLGATFFEPNSLPEGFFVLGYFCRSNKNALFGFVLAGKDNGFDGEEALKKPVDYTLVWSTESSKIKRDGNGYIWSPTPPDGYRAVGHVVTASREKPSVDKIRCVRSDLTEECEKEAWIWGPMKSGDENGFNIYSSRPKNRGITETGVSTGAFVALPAPTTGNSPLPQLFCLKNLNSISAAMPDLSQIDSLYQAYSPVIYYHPKEKYLPSSVDWFFSGGALLYDKSNESNSVPINPDGSNLPQGGSNDGQFWLNLPTDEEGKEKLKKGDLQSCKVYLHVKPMIGGTFTDIATWIFFPFNGPATAKVGIIDIPFTKIGEHIGDWEHITLRISNFTGELGRVYFAQHSKGEWVDPPSLEFEKGNKVVAYSSLNGHASYSKPGLVLQGAAEIGIRNETAKSGLVLDTGTNYLVIAAEYLEGVVEEPAWVNYTREWGPKIEYPIVEEIEKVENLLPGRLKEGFRGFVNKLPDEIRGEEGPTGPKMKNSWNGDEP
ncbi:hypothetical protein IC582_030487 [Cucumis melo]|uniref:Uncharacterized protein LOC103500280 n=2 Tax=Cucumis melo TaxID=3656 RepID=A0A1S3CFF1_CUCME|nr:hypothetical protein At1g04090-like [Cucumis melo]KAA0051465.1 DUF946 domain-containing protein [Cucumis melo var. makuwa]TYK04156.1 DUF946 domain-containing protein [Cucumis melo var. makuwa]